MGHFAIASSKYSTHTLFSRGVFKEDTQFQMPDDIMTFSSINFKWNSVFSAGTMLTEREWNANWQSSTKLKIKHSNGAHYLSHTQQWIREAEGCNEQWAYWQCFRNSTFISRQSIHSQWSTKKRSTSCDLVGGEQQSSCVRMALRNVSS